MDEWAGAYAVMYLELVPIIINKVRGAEAVPARSADEGDSDFRVRRIN